MPVSRSATSVRPISRQLRPIASTGGIAPGGTTTARPTRRPLRESPPRVLLPILFDGSSDTLRVWRGALLRSPLGVYVSHIDAHRERMAVWLDLAHEDLGFAIHTVLATLPRATFGGLRRRAT